MKLLILTQKIDTEDKVLGFFHAWVLEIAKHFEHVTVICLGKGRYNLPQNVTILSLGKELGVSKIKYILNFYKYIWRERKNYDAVFVHMNQEYMLLGGKVWWMLGKRVLFWRNHPQGNFLTKIASLFVHKVLYTSPFSYTAPFKKGIQMPVGIDTELFKPSDQVRKEAVLFFGRIAPVKKPEILIDALVLENKKNNKLAADIVGDSLPKDQAYFDSLKNKVNEFGLNDQVTFLPGVTHEKAVEFLRSYKVYVNTTPTGSMDKTIFEAMASGTFLLTSNRALTNKIPDEFIFTENDPADLGIKLSNLMATIPEEMERKGEMLRKYVVDNHSLKALVDKLTELYGEK